MELKLFTGGTLETMEWVRDNKETALKLNFTAIYNRHGMRVGTISLEMRNATLEDWYKMEKVEAYEYKGMRRSGGFCGSWLFEIDGNIYLYTE